MNSTKNALLTASSDHTWSPNSFNEILLSASTTVNTHISLKYFMRRRSISPATREHIALMSISPYYISIWNSAIASFQEWEWRHETSNQIEKNAQVIQSRYFTRCMRKTVENLVRGTRAVRLERRIDVAALLFGYLNFIRSEQKSHASDARCKYRHRNIRRFGIVKSKVNKYKST